MSIWERILDPVSLRRDVRRLSAEQLKAYVRPGMKVYDIGCGARPFKAPVEALGAVYTGVDIPDGFYDSSHIDLPGNAYEVPISDAAADAVISCQVLEHLERPEAAVAETARILKDGGLLFVSVPFLYPLHAAPRDFFRYTAFGLEALLVRNGFEILDRRFLGGFWYALAIQIGLYLQGFDRGVMRRIYVIRAVSALLRWLCAGFHALEGFALSLAGNKDRKGIQFHWSVNHLMVARRTARRA